MNQASERVQAPGRVNLIGEHIDYHGLPVLPMALRRYIRVSFKPRDDRCIRAESAGYGTREFEWKPSLEPASPGDWENYVRAAAQAVAQKWGVGRGINAVMTSNLPAAAGLSSSSALIVAVTLALVRANGIAASFEDLMEILPEGEHFVGTRGGAMDHAASLDSHAGCASLIEFDPVKLRHVPIPADWAFLAAHSLTAAEKSGGAREAYNARRQAGTAALQRLGFTSYRAALAAHTAAELAVLADHLEAHTERPAFLHVVTEASRVHAAVRAMERGDARAFGALLLESHASLRDRLRVSNAALDRLVETAIESGALGARLTGAGFGGCAVIFTTEAEMPRVRRGLVDRFYQGAPEFDARMHLIDAEPGPGALH